MIAGGKGWEDMENYGLSKYEWLTEFLTLLEGIPSADTFRRVFERINPRPSFVLKSSTCFNCSIRELPIIFLPSRLAILPVLGNETALLAKGVGGIFKRLKR